MCLRIINYKSGTSQYNTVIFKSLFGVCLCIFALLLLIGPANAIETATIHGAIYEWDTFEPLENVLIEVNSTPPQSIVAKYGIYSLDLAPGDYLIVATYYSGNLLVASTQESITVSDDGDYIIDLLLLPSYSDEGLDDPETANLSRSFEVDSQIIEDDSDSSSLFTYLLIILILSIVGLSAYIFSKKGPNNSKEHTLSSSTSADHFDERTNASGHNSNISGQNVIVSDNLTSSRVDTDDQNGIHFGDIKSDSESVDHVDDIENASLPDDLQEILDIVISNGGRITQKELRGKLRYSEAKVSLIVSDLENRGIVEKFKKGRGNIIIIRDDKI